MDIFTGVIVALISSSLGYVLSYYIARRLGNRAYEPDFVNAQLALQEERFREAAELFEEVISEIEKANPLYLNALAGLFQAYPGVGDVAKANRYLEQAIEIAEHINNPIFKSQLFKLKQPTVINKSDHQYE